MKPIRNCVVWMFLVCVIWFSPVVEAGSAYGPSCTTFPSPSCLDDCFETYCYAPATQGGQDEQEAQEMCDLIHDALSCSTGSYRAQREGACWWICVWEGPSREPSKR